jgi:hypothetical protein
MIRLVTPGRLTENYAKGLLLQRRTENPGAGSGALGFFNLSPIF